MVGHPARTEGGRFIKCVGVSGPLSSPAVIKAIMDTEKRSERRSSHEQDVVDFDDLLPHVGEFGLYQKLLFLMMIPFTFCVAWVYFSQIFITLVPERHWCRIPELDHLPLEQR